MKNNILLFFLCGLAGGFVIGNGIAYGSDEASNMKQTGQFDIRPVSPDYFIPNRFKGKTILITGGARGIGKGTAIRAAREGANVVVADWLPKDGAATVEMINQEGGKAIFVLTDVRNSSDCDNMVTQAVKVFGSLDYAVNCAGVIDGVYSGEPFDYEKQKSKIPAELHKATDEYWDFVIAVNAGGVFKSLRAELRQMIAQEKGGAIVNVGSVAGLTGRRGNPAYVASKHAVTGLTRNAAVAYAPYGIRVNSVNPSHTDTPMGKRNIQIQKPMDAYDRKLKLMNPLRASDSHHRFATVWEQAAAILFLLSDESSYITGGCYPTDGGWTAF